MVLFIISWSAHQPYSCLYSFANLIQSLESELNGLLGKLRETAGTGAMKALPWVNRYVTCVCPPVLW